MTRTIVQKMHSLFAFCSTRDNCCWKQGSLGVKGVGLSFANLPGSFVPHELVRPYKPLASRLC